MDNFFQAPNREQIEQLIAAAAGYKADPWKDEALGRRKTLVQLYLNPSLRTRLSTTVAAERLGMRVQTLDTGSSWGLEFGEGVRMDTDKAEHVQEAAAVISQYADIIGLRTFAGLKDWEADYQDTTLLGFSKFARVPMLSLESAVRHPLQSLADLLTLREHAKTQRPKVVLTWAPHPRSLPQAVANSFAEWTLAAGYDLTIASPEGCELDSSFTSGAKCTSNQDEALADADFVYAKNWSSTKDYGSIVKGHDDWQITAEKMSLTNDGKFMHCLPVRRNVVVSDSVLNSTDSLVIEQANNRQWAAQAALAKLLRA